MTLRYVFLLIPKDHEKESLTYSTNNKLCGLHFDNNYYVYRIDTLYMFMKRIK